LLPNGDTTIVVFGSDPRFQSSTGLQDAFTYVSKFVLFQRVTIKVPSGRHNVTSKSSLTDVAIRFEDFPSCGLVRIVGEEPGNTVLVFDPAAHIAISVQCLSYLSIDGLVLERPPLPRVGSADPFCLMVEEGSKLKGGSLECVNFCDALGSIANLGHAIIDRLTISCPASICPPGPAISARVGASMHLNVLNKGDACRIVAGTTGFVWVSDMSGPACTNNCLGGSIIGAC
jgi:hypothetical protein